MQKVKAVNKDVQLSLTDGILKDEDLKRQMLQLDDKVQQMLTWSSICSIWSYLVLIVVIARLYRSLGGQHTFFLAAGLMSMYILMGIIIYVTWRATACNRIAYHSTGASFLKQQISKLSRQRKLTAYYLLEYALLMAVASVFFFADIENGLTLILKITIPVSIITYTLGIYFIGKFTSQMKKLDLIERQLTQLILEKSFNLN